MVVPSTLEGREDFGRLCWRMVRRESARTAVMLALAAPGLVAGLWYTNEWKSAWAAIQVTELSAAATLLAGYLGWRLVARLRGRPRSDPPQMLRAVLGGEAALVTPPHRSAGMIVVVAGVAAWLAISGVAIRVDAIRPDRAQVLIPAVLVAYNLVDLLGYRFGPRLALFSDRIEIRRGLGRYLVPWSAIMVVHKRKDGVMVYLRPGGSSKRRGWIRRHPAYGVPVDDLGIPADLAIDTIERCQREHRTTLRRLAGPALP